MGLRELDMTLFLAENLCFVSYIIPLLLKNRWMRVNVTLQHFNVGVCINNVSDVDITIDGTTYRVYPGNPEVDSFLRFESRIVSCRDCKLADFLVYWCFVQVLHNDSSSNT